MKTAYLGHARLNTSLLEKEFPLNERVFVIGVKSSSECDIDGFVKGNPTVKILKRFPATLNLNYPGGEEYHTLQPAFMMRTK